MENSELIRLRHTLHSEPEISNQEFNTSSKIRTFLLKTKPDTMLALGKTGFAVIYKGSLPGPTVVFRSELDALPITEESNLPYRSKKAGIAHLCGHDGHMTILAGLGLEIAQKRPNHGKAVLLFQHAEEAEQGARDITENQEFISLKTDYIFALHNIPGANLHKVIVREGCMTAASRGMTVKLTGRSAHAAEPEKGVNPSLAISEIIGSLKKLGQDKQLFRELTLLTVIHIKMGEISFGTSPGNATICFTLRAFRNDDMKKLTLVSEKIIQKISDKEQLKCDISYSEEFPATENNAACVRIVENAARENGHKISKPVVPYTWSEDFAYYTRLYRGCLFGLGSGKRQPALHNPDYDFPDDLIGTGVGMFKKIYMNLLL